MSAPLFLLDAAGSPGEPVTLTGPEGRHAGRVQRLRVGERCLLSDGRGWIGEATVVSVSAGEVGLMVETAEVLPAPVPHFTVVQALPKGDRAELAVAMLTEVGVDRIVPWAAEHCVARWTGDKVRRGQERWAATARESAKQSRRAFVPEVAALASLNDVAEICAAADLAVVLEAGAPVSVVDVAVPVSGSVVVVVGPEGGLAQGERRELGDRGAIEARLGPEVLRTSTAGPVAVALLQSRTPRWEKSYPWIS